MSCTGLTKICQNSGPLGSRGCSRPSEVSDSSEARFPLGRPLRALVRQMRDVALFRRLGAVSGYRLPWPDVPLSWDNRRPGRLTSPGDSQRRLPEWLPGPNAPSSPGYENVARRPPSSPAATSSPASRQDRRKPCTPAGTWTPNPQLTHYRRTAWPHPPTVLMPGTVEHRQVVSTYRTKRTAGSAAARQPPSGKGFATLWLSRNGRSGSPASSWPGSAHWTNGQRHR